MQMFDFIAVPLGAILSFIYNIVNSYGLAIIIFTILIKVILLPLSVKQTKSQNEMNRIQPKVREIEKKFKGDKQKIQEETMKLYKQEGVSVTGGCLPLVIQLPIIFGLYQVIYRPLTHLSLLSESAITSLREVYGLDAAASELQLANLMQANPGLSHSIVSDFTPIDFNFLGINLSLIPKFDISSVSAFFSSIDILWIIPLISITTALLSSFSTKKFMPTPQTSDPNSAQAKQTKSMSNSMLFMMPVMSLYFSFILPTGVGVYWSLSNILMAIQQYALFKLIKPPAPALTEKEIRKLNKIPYEERISQQKQTQVKRVQKPRPATVTGKNIKQLPPKKKMQGQPDRPKRPPSNTGSNPGKRPLKKPSQRPVKPSSSIGQSKEDAAIKENFDHTRGKNKDD